ncbi:MAG: DUF2829 domain-containing protein [Blautia sp.]
MLFKEAFELMKKGMKVKLPSWGGYWRWDQEKETIMMHCRPQDSDKGQESVLDIRETQRVEYTVCNILSDEWVVADESNTPVLGGIATFNFCDAIKYLKRGMKVARKGWNGKGMFLEYVDPYMNRQFRLTETDPAGTFLPWIGMKTADNGFVPWLASQTDMLSEDWVFVD